MRNLIVKMLLVTALISISPITFCQQGTDGKFLFKMWLFIEHVNNHSRSENDYPLKDSSLFSLFDSVVDLKLDTLKSKGFNSNIVFYSVARMKNNKIISDSAITYDAKTKYLSYVSIPVYNCNDLGYVLCVNTISGRSYRVQGFYENDFLGLLQEVKEEYRESRGKKLSTKLFLKTYSVENIDFSCIYKGLKSGKAKDYSCLRRCSDFTVIIH